MPNLCVINLLWKTQRFPEQHYLLATLLACPHTKCAVYILLLFSSYSCSLQHVYVTCSSEMSHRWLKFSNQPSKINRRQHIKNFIIHYIIFVVKYVFLQKMYDRVSIRLRLIFSIIHALKTGYVSQTNVI